MRAVVHDRYGPAEVLRVDEVEAPSPADDQLLVRVHASAVTRSDVAWRAAKPFLSRFVTGLRTPRHRIPGSDFAGVVERVGAGVTEFEPGDRVFGSTGGFRANAEYLCVRAAAPVAEIPIGMTFVEAAAVSDGAILALNCLRLVELGGRRLLVYGASGSMGTAGVQLGKHLGAHVTAVCGTDHVDLVQSLGADRVIDYRREDFRNGETYDVIFDAVGKRSFVHDRCALVEGGIFLPTDGFLNLFFALPTRWIGKRKVLVQLPPRYRKDDVLVVKRLLEEGAYRPVVDRTYPLEEVVEAARYVETGQKTGNVVLTLS
jgi:NADPH:quinone reductase-like Zn-dependent oxidoreductase